MTKAELIEKANTLRRNAVRECRKVGSVMFSAQITGLRCDLLSAGVPADDVAALLPAIYDAGSPCRLKPLADHVVIRPADPKAMTEGGIVIPDSAKEVPMRGEVLAVGPGRIEPGVGTVLPSVKVGDEVLFGRYAGVEVTLDGEEVRIMREEDVLGILMPEEKT